MKVKFKKRTETVNRSFVFWFCLINGNMLKFKCPATFSEGQRGPGRVFLWFADHTWVDAGATASAAVVLLSDNYLPPDSKKKKEKFCWTKSKNSGLTE